MKRRGQPRRGKWKTESDRNIGLGSWESRADKGGPTCFNDTAAAPDVEPRGDKGDVGEIENLGAVGECHRPELWGGAEDVDEAVAVARADLGAVGDADEIVVPVVAKAAVEVLSRGDEERLDELSGLWGGERGGAGVVGCAPAI